MLLAASVVVFPAAVHASNVADGLRTAVMDHVTASHVVDSWHIYIILLQISARSADILVFLGNTRSGRKQFVTQGIY